jgi:hypothetical protein
MKQAPTALQGILRECGITRKEAFRIERCIDQSNDLGLNSDDVAGALLRWKATCEDRAFDDGVRAGLDIPFAPDVPGQRYMLVARRNEDQGTAEMPLPS